MHNVDKSLNTIISYRRKKILSGLDDEKKKLL